MSDEIFPCSGCGACCRRVNKAVENFKLLNTDNRSEMFFPYKWDDSGKCEMLTTDNKCSVYKNRPLMCNIDKLLSFTDIPKEQFYAMNIASCNMMMDEDGLPLEFRIK